MVPYALKVLWFALSLSGLLSSWIVLPAFPRTVVREPWIPVVYGMVNTALQGIFCLGLIWRMDPFRMPHEFCIAQTAIIHLCWSFLAALCASISVKSTSDMFPGTRLGELLRGISGRLSRVVLIALFPIFVLAVQLVFLLRLDAAQPTDGLNCDASSPTWVRLLGYAGTSLLLAVPSLLLSISTAVRLACPLLQQGQAANSSGHTNYSHDALTALPIRPSRTRGSKPRYTDSFQYSIPESPIPAHSTLRLPKTLFPQSPEPPLSPGRTPSQAKHSKFHLPFSNGLNSTPSSRRPSFATARDSPVRELDRSRNSSYRSGSAPSPIIFSSPSRAEGRGHEPTVVNISPSPHPMSDEDDEDEDYENKHENDDGSITEVHHGIYELDVSAADGGAAWVTDLDNASITKDKDVFGYEITEEDEEPSQYAFPPYPRIRKSPSGRPPWIDEPVDLAPPPARLVAFQIFLSATFTIASITSLVDILSHRTMPTPFGTQHVALVLVGWGPALFVAVCTLLRWISCSPGWRPTLALCRR